MSKTNTLLIRTPEGIVFSQLLADPVTRFLAWFIDLLCVSVLTAGFGLVIGIFALVSLDLALALRTLVFFVISISYGILMEWYCRGQTLGKKLFRLRVVDVQGLRLHFSQIVIRNLLRFVDMLPLFYLVGGLACLLSRRAQRLGDFAANTVVIRHPRIQEPDLDQLLTGKYNSLRDYPHLEARLRQQISAAEAGIAVLALLRRDLLEPAARVELFEQIARHFRARVEFPPEATDGVTDEQYVRNVVDVLYRTRGGAKVKPRTTPEPVAADEHR